MDRLQYSLTYEGITTILDVAPVSWDKSILKTERQIGVWGVTRAFQFQFEFVKDGADILRNAFYNNGIEADVTILIEKFNYISHEYEEIYSGKINFAKFIDDTISVKVDAIEGNLPQLLKANENTKYQIAYNDFYRHYQILKDIYNFSNAQVNYTGTVAVEYIFLKYPIKLTKSSEVENIGGQVTVKNSTLTAGVQTAVLGYIFDEDNTFLTADKDCTINLDVDIKHFIERYAITFDDVVDLWLRYDLELWKYDNDSSNWILLDRKRDEVFYDNITSVTRSNGYVNFLTQKTYELKSGDKLAWQVNINWFAVGDGTWTGGEYEDGYTLSTKCNITIGEQIYDVPCISLIDLLNELGNKITGNLTGIESTYFAEKNIIFFSGNAIRGFPNSVLNISFNDIFKFLNSINGAGFGVENNKIVIENRGYFFEDTEIEEFLNSNDFSIEHAEELIYNTVKVGNNSPAIEGKYGNYEPNNQFIFGLPITKVQKDLNLISPIRTDSLGIDALRVAQNFSNSDSKDNSNDNEIFAVVCKPFPEIVEFIAPIYEVNVPPVEYWLGGDMTLIGTSPANADLKVTYGDGTIVYPFSLYPATGNIQVISFTKFGYTEIGYESVKIEWNNDTVQMNEIINNLTLLTEITIYKRVYEALKTDYTITSGVPTDISADIFNKSLSPKRCLINNSDLLNTALYKQPQSNEVVFLSSLKNNAMVSSDLTENAALKRSEFNTAIFDPIYYNCTVPVSAGTWQKILNTPKGYFSVWYKDVKYLGYILEASLNSALRSEMKIKLLAKTPADLEPIDYRFFEHNRTIGDLGLSFYMNTRNDLGDANFLIDFGDGTQTEYLIKTNAGGGTTITHTYSAAGVYMVQIKSGAVENNKVNSITITTQNVVNFYGSKYWVNLKEVYIYNNDLSNLELKKEWVEIQTIHAYNNKITTFAAYKENNKLVTIYLFGNLLTEFIGYNEWVNLTSLFLYENNIDRFELLNWENLTAINLYYNQLTTFINNSNCVDLTLIQLLINTMSVDVVNNLLISEDAKNLTKSCTINISGGTNAAPTGAGITAKNNLISRGYTVTTN